MPSQLTLKSGTFGANIQTLEDEEIVPGSHLNSLTFLYSKIWEHYMSCQIKMIYVRIAEFISQFAPAFYDL